jgi:type IX secretion system PorP/SprF family membrane protein
MRIEIKYILALVFCFTLGRGGLLKAQDPTFSQVYAAPVYLSPSFAGLTDGGRLVLNYRDQWPSIPNTYRTVSFSVDHFFEKYNSGLGILFMRDDQGGGQLLTQNIGLVYAYEFPLSDNLYMRPGMNFKYAERKIDPTNLVWGDQIGSNGEYLTGTITDFDQEQYRKFDASASAMVYNDFFWAGVVVDHLIKSDLGFTDLESPLPMKTIVYGGGKYRYRSASRNRSEQSVSLAFMYRMQEEFQQLDMGSYWNVNPFEVGLWYRGIPVSGSSGLTNNDALIFIMGFNIGSIRLAYSYDLTLSNLAGYSGGSNEFSIIYRFDTSSSNNSPRGSIPCSDAGDSWLINKSKFRSRHRSIF